MKPDQVIIKIHAGDGTKEAESCVFEKFFTGNECKLAALELMRQSALDRFRSRYSDLQVSRIETIEIFDEYVRF